MADILFEEERVISHSFELPRLQDFCGGRHCAHQCLSHFELNEPLLKSAHGNRLWPDPVIGSISHSKFLSGAVVMPKGDYRAVGLDVETIGRVDRELWSLFFIPEEIDWLLSKPPQYQCFFATLFFSFKEAFFKMQFSITKTFAEFDDCSISYSSGKVIIQPLNQFLNIGGIHTHYAEHQTSVIAMVYC